jgi:hypothetical protein
MFVFLLEPKDKPYLRLRNTGLSIWSKTNDYLVLLLVYRSTFLASVSDPDQAFYLNPDPVPHPGVFCHHT